MNINKKEYIEELDRNYSSLGEDLLMLESILLMPEGETGFPGECAASGLERVRGYAVQHMDEIGLLTGRLTGALNRIAP